MIPETIRADTVVWILPLILPTLLIRVELLSLLEHLGRIISHHVAEYDLLLKVEAAGDDVASRTEEPMTEVRVGAAVELQVALDESSR